MKDKTILQNSITLENVSKTFEIKDDRKYTIKSLVASLFRQGNTNVFKALDDINIEIEKGQFVGIIGKNGSGKSTLLKLIAGIYNYDKGGRIVTQGKIVPFLELGVGFNHELSGRENIYLNGTILGLTKSYINNKIKDIIEFAELEEFIDTPVKNYSSGMQVRLAFSIAAQAEADIYILDEILAVGDQAFQRKSLDFISKLKRKGKTILYVSHDSNSIITLCDRAILIDKHKVLADGEPSDVVGQYMRLIDKRTESDNQVNGENIKNRWGNGRGEIFDVEIKNDSGKLVNEFTEKDVIKIEFKSNIKEDFPNLAYAILIHSNEDTYITGSNLDYQFDEDHSVQKGKYSKSIEVPAKFFVTDSYKISLAIYDMDTITPLDHHDRQYKISIYNEKRDQGLVSLPIKWGK